MDIFYCDCTKFNGANKKEKEHNAGRYIVEYVAKNIYKIESENDITLEETKEILKKANKKVILYGLGHLNYMYTRRTLNSNYAKHFNYEINKE